MSHDDFDLGPLTWVKGEIDQALASVLELAASLREQPSDVSPVRFMLTHLHQVYGALDMVGLEGAKYFCHTLETMADRFGKRELEPAEEVVAAFTHGVRTLSDYLEDLVNGAPDIPLQLFPALSGLMRAQGEGVPEESVLFFPDTSTRAPSDLPTVEIDDKLLPEYLAGQRRKFQRALLNWMRLGKPGYISEMREVIDAVTQSQRLAMHKTLWWVASATLEALEHEGIKSGAQIIRIFRRLDQHLRLMVEGAARPTGTLMRELLYQVAKSAPVSERVRQVKHRFDLDVLLPSSTQEFLQMHKPGGESAALTVLRGAIPRLKDAWTTVVEKGCEKLAEFLAALQAIEPSRQALSNAALAELLQTIRSAAERLANEPQSLNDELGMDMAAALNASGDALEGYAHLGEDFSRQAAQLISRLCQQPSATAPGELPATIDVSTLAAVSHEIKATLQHVEETLDAYFRNPAQRDLLAPLGNALHQVAGAFGMMELPVASALTEKCRRFVEWFATQQTVPDAIYFEKVAEGLSALVYLVDEAMHKGSSAEHTLAVTLEGVERLWKELETATAAASAQSVPSEAVKTAPKRRRTKKVTDQARDAELLDIYLTEAEEVLDTVGVHLASLRSAAGDQAALVELRRGFHTLKGSGRTVGLVGLGEVAWQVEKVLNQLIESKQSPSAADLDFVAEVQAAFGTWVAQLKQIGSVAVDPVQWQQKAESIASTELAPPMPQAPEDVVIGGAHRVSRVLFNLFQQEARNNLDTLTNAFQAARSQSTQAPDADCVRAAHTIAGISRTTGLSPLAELAGALELWLENNTLSTRPWTATGWSVLERVVQAMEQMLSRIVALRKPRPATHLLDLMQDIPLTAASAPPEMQQVTQVEQVTPQSPLVEHGVVSPERQLLDIFLEEARELFPLVGSELREWRTQPENSEAPRSLQRALHTLKGGARMAGEAVLGDAIHELESRVIQVLKTTPGTSDFDQMFMELDNISGQLETIERSVSGVSAPSTVVTQAAASLPEYQAPVAQSLRVRADTLDDLVNEAGEISIARSRIEREMGVFKQSLGELTESVSRLRSYLRELEIEADSRLQAHSTLLQEAGEAFDPLEFDRYTRLQELTRMMAESVNDVATTQHGLLDNLDETEAALQDQRRMNRDLQQELMHIRMIPFSVISERLHRIVRQTSRELGTRVELAIDGDHAEIDRSVLEKIVAPLEHLLRNAIAHGIEPADLRAAANKSEIGHIGLAVRQEKNEIIITVTDDGAGIDLERVRARATERGMFEQGHVPDDDVLMSVIFESGFSTSTEVTQVSGRGVGLDVVRNDISMLGGRIDVASQRGQGATFSIYLPATLTMSQVVLIRAGSHTYAVPSVMVEQVQQLKAAVLNAGYAEGNLPWAGRRYPLHYLPRLVGDDGTAPESQRSSPVLLLRSGTFHIALHVDEILGNHEVVVKPIGPQLTLVPGIVGATVLGDGKIMLIINPVQLANRAILAAGAVHVSALPAATENVARSVMVVDDSLTMRKVLSRLLTREGYRVLTAKDGMEALQMLQDEIPDAVVLDIEMPRMDGFELARNIRDDQRTASLPLIVVSSRTAEKHRNIAREIGVNVYLGKPVQDEELLASLSSLLEKSETAPAIN